MISGGARRTRISTPLNESDIEEDQQARISERYEATVELHHFVKIGRRNFRPCDFLRGSAFACCIAVGRYGISYANTSNLKTSHVCFNITVKDHAV